MSPRESKLGKLPSSPNPKERTVGGRTELPTSWHQVWDGTGGTIVDPSHGCTASRCFEMLRDGSRTGHFGATTNFSRNMGTVTPFVHAKTQSPIFVSWIWTPAAVSRHLFGPLMGWNRCVFASKQSPRLPGLSYKQTHQTVGVAKHQRGQGKKGSDECGSSCSLVGRVARGIRINTESTPGCLLDTSNFRTQITSCPLKATSAEW